MGPVTAGADALRGAPPSWKAPPSFYAWCYMHRLRSQLGHEDSALRRVHATCGRDGSAALEPSTAHARPQHCTEEAAERHHECVRGKGQPLLLGAHEASSS